MPDERSISVFPSVSSCRTRSLNSGLSGAIRATSLAIRWASASSSARRSGATGTLPIASDAATGATGSGGVSIGGCSASSAIGLLLSEVVDVQRFRRARQVAVDDRVRIVRRRGRIAGRLLDRLHALRDPADQVAQAREEVAEAAHGL